MINSKKDYYYYLNADRIALGRVNKGKNIQDFIKSFFLADEIWDFQKLLRKIEYYKNNKTSFFSKVRYAFLIRRFHKLSVKLGFSISANIIGPGLSIAHHGTIIINSGARIGANCRIHCDVNIGTQAGYSDKAPKIGDNVYIGPGAKIYGAIQIANNTAIGANAVVNMSFLKENTAIAGVPAKIISEQIDIYDLLIPATDIVSNPVYSEILGQPASVQNAIRKGI